ncbi:MAG: hypothetical protein O7G31_17005 [Calditrichaeota bacterium]|nr:hypothetical protein [Calditrichota bacterium]
MASPAKVYQKEMHNNVGFFATWLPGDHIELGAVGVMKDGQFRQEATLRDLGIKYKPSDEGSPQPLRYTSSSGTSISSSAGAKVPAVTADITIEFSSEGSFLFDALNVRQVRIKNRFDVTADILECYEEGKWNKEWYVVESLHVADSATIIVSQDKSAGLVMAASSELPIPSTTLSDPKLDLAIKSTHGKIFQIVAGRDLKPLYSCLRLKDDLFKAPKVVPVRGSISREASTKMFARPSIDELLES